LEKKLGKTVRKEVSQRVGAEKSRKREGCREGAIKPEKNF